MSNYTNPTGRAGTDQLEKSPRQLEMSSFEPSWFNLDMLATPTINQEINAAFLFNPFAHYSCAWNSGLDPRIGDDDFGSSQDLFALMSLKDATSTEPMCPGSQAFDPRLSLQEYVSPYIRINSTHHPLTTDSLFLLSIFILSEHRTKTMVRVAPISLQRRYSLVHSCHRTHHI